jgi:hypothetical protein
VKAPEQVAPPIPPTIPVIRVESLAMPEPLPPPAPPAPETPVTPADSVQADAPAPAADADNLVFQLAVAAPGSGSKGQGAPVENDGKALQTESFSVEAVPQVAPSHESSAGTKNQNQHEEPPPSPQPLPSAVSTDGTVASQFGFQTPLLPDVHTAAPRIDSTAQTAPTRTIESTAAPDLPVAPTVDRIGLTLRGADDQVVRVEVHQSGEIVQIGVHTANNDLAGELRMSVPMLVHRLDQQGYEPKVNALSAQAPAGPVSTPIASAQTEFRSGTDTQRDLGYEDRAQQQRQRNPQRAWRELAEQLQEG